MQATADRDGAGEHAHGVNREDNTLGEMMVRLPYRPTLSEALKAGILAMVAAASGTKRCQMEAGGLVPLMGRGAQRFDSIRQAAGI